MSDGEQTSGRDDLGDDATIRRSRGPVPGHTPGEGRAPVVRTPVAKTYRGRVPVSGQDPEVDAMRLAAQEPWTCACGTVNRYYVFRCRRCSARRPW